MPWHDILANQGFAIVAALALAWWINRSIERHNRENARRESDQVARIRELEEKRIVETRDYAEKAATTNNMVASAMKDLAKVYARLIHALNARPCLQAKPLGSDCFAGAESPEPKPQVATKKHNTALTRNRRGVTTQIIRKAAKL
jgi:hypothetical protein